MSEEYSSVTVGVDCTVNYLTSGARATWAEAPDSTTGMYIAAAPADLAEMTCVRNVTLNDSSSEGDGSSRASIAKLVVLALDEYSVEIEIPNNPSDSGFQALRNARVNRSVISLAILDGPSTTVGSQGLWADFVVTAWNREENIDKEVVIKATCKPTPTAVAPQWVSVASGS